MGFQVVTLTAHSIPLPDHVGWTIRATLSGRPQGGAAARSPENTQMRTQRCGSATPEQAWPLSEGVEMIWQDFRLTQTGIARPLKTR